MLCQPARKTEAGWLPFVPVPCLVGLPPHRRTPSSPNFKEGRDRTPEMGIIPTAFPFGRWARLAWDPEKGALVTEGLGSQAGILSLDSTLKGESPMAVVKVIELVGESKESWQHAAQEAVREAAKTVRNITGVEVLNWTGEVDSSGNITGYRADVQVAFRVDNQGRG